MAAVRLIGREERLEMEKKDKDIASLLAALCDRPLALDESEPASALRDFCSEAAAALRRHGDGLPDTAGDPASDPDVAAALIASVHSGTLTEAERAAFEQAATRSAAFRLDALSALAFVDAIEGAGEPAPAHLVASLAAAAVRPEPRQWAWRLPAVRLRWRMAAACTVVLAAGALTSGLYLRPIGVERDVGPAVAPAITEKDEPAAAPPPAVASRVQPVAPEPDAAKVASCPPAALARSAVPRRLASGQPAKPMQEESDCAPAGPRPVAASPVAVTPAGADPAVADNADDPPGREGTQTTVAARRAEALRKADAARRLGAAERAHGPAAVSGAHPAAAAARPAAPPLCPGDHAPAATTTRPAAIDLAR